MKILMVLTSHDALGDTGEKTGYWVEEFAAPYYAFRDEGHDVVLASTRGGRPPADPKSEADDAQTAATRRLATDAEAQAALDATLPLSDVSAERFDAVFYPGGHGPLWDLATDARSIALIEDFLAADKPVAAVCHGPAVLRDVTLLGAPAVKGRQVTGFTDSEEAAVGLTHTVPFSIEQEFKSRGAMFERGADFTPYAVRDGLIITGQNPMSSEKTAELLLGVLSHLRAA